MAEDLRSQWLIFVTKHVHSLTLKFKNVHSDKERLQICWETLRGDPTLNDIVDQIKNKIQTQCDNYDTSMRPSLDETGVSSEENKLVLPTLAKGRHSKISNGSALIQLNCSKSQGRYLEAKDQIKAGDVLILEKPYAAVLVHDNQSTHCSHCFQFLQQQAFVCQTCQLKYCSAACQRDAWKKYHKEECFLKPLLEMLDISSHLTLRLLLVTGPTRLLQFTLEEDKVQSGVCKDFSLPDRIPGCTTDGLYPGDYGCVYSLVTNTELQPTEALVAYALDSAFVTDIAFDYIYGQLKPKLCDEDLPDSCILNGGITKEIMGCLLLHHMQQMPCNIHAVTAVVSVNEELSSSSGVRSKEQKRIAAGIYPTASLMNHACDPDVIVSFLGGSLVVRATHNIKPGEEIAHCYGPSASRMTREVRQSLLQKQYFFTCGCSACKSDEDLEEQYIYDAVFLCQKCSYSVTVSQENGKNIGKCQNSKCGSVKDFSSEVETVKDAQKLFNEAILYLEEGSCPKSVAVLKECLKKRQNVLQKYDKDVAETHDALARCYATLGDFRQASFHCEQSTESVRRRFGAESIEYAHELHKFGQLLFNGRQVSKANSVIDNAIRLLTIHYGGQYSDVEELLQMKKTLKGFL